MGCLRRAPVRVDRVDREKHKFRFRFDSTAEIDSKNKNVVVVLTDAPLLVQSFSSVLVVPSVEGESDDEVRLRIPATRGPNTRTPVLTKKDISVVDKALEVNADYIEISNVYRAEDLAELQDLTRRKLNTRLLVNIEHPETIDHLDDILSACHGVVICRNWLSAFLPTKFNTVVQQEVIAKCKSRGKLVMVKGHFLEDMKTGQSSVPGCSETSDIFSLVSQAPDGLILERQSELPKVQADRLLQTLTDIIW